MNSPNDSLIMNLVQRARAGDEVALNELFRNCRNYLGVIAQANVENWLRAKVDSSDVVQQTMLEAHRGFAKFKGNSEKEWLAWLKQILNHNVADFIRHWRYAEKRQIKREVSLQTPNDRSTLKGILEPADKCDTPSQQLMQRERELIVADALKRLPVDYQEVIMLRNLQRLPFDQVAERMGRSRPAVQMLWTRALKKLQEEMVELR